MFERFTEQARQAVVLAQDESRALKHHYIGTEHLLLGIVRENEAVAARVLRDFDADAEQIRGEVIVAMLSGPRRRHPRTPSPPSDPRHGLEALTAAKELLIERQELERAAEVRDLERRLMQLMHDAREALSTLGEAFSPPSNYRVETLEGASETWPDQLLAWRQDGWWLVTIVPEGESYRAVLERRGRRIVVSPKPA